MLEKYGIGTIHNSKNHGEFLIIEKIEGNKRKIKFLKDGIEKIVSLTSVRKGKVSSIRHKTYDIGTIHKTKNYGDIEILEIINWHMRKIKFLQNGEEKVTSTASIRTGSINCDSLLKYAIGSKHNTNEGYVVEIVDFCEDSGYRIIKFLDKYGHTSKYHMSNIKEGSISNPYHPSVSGVGYFGVGEYVSSTNRNHELYYTCWINMIKRCYDKTNRKLYNSYKNVTVCEEWHNFQVFAKWYEENYPQHIEGILFELDKDFLQIGIENKVYSPETCIFLPTSINSFLCSVSNKIEGVHYHKYNNTFIAQIYNYNRDNRYLGSFDTYEEAKSIYINEKIKDVNNMKLELIKLGYIDLEIIEEIATQIVAELNEKRFERVSE